MRKRIGYFDGTDSNLLTMLVCQGYDTIPVSNGRDNHGEHVRLLNDRHRHDLLIGHLHKVFAPQEPEPSDATYQDIFHICRTYSIPLLIVVPAHLHDRARQLLDDPPPIVRLVDPEEALEVALGVLGGDTAAGDGTSVGPTSA